ncbi:MAG: response regulator transcription factor [Saprospiraceae bacterium]|nr:response regulator transcription factor [Saprospiraceae bacterium]MCB9326054.1 response regulator transcription factor [Lewinellaceae bacterium]
MNEIKVLIVEDEPLIAQDIASILEGYDYSIAGIANAPAKAMEFLSNNTPDIAILDVNLNAESDGISLGEYILKNHNFPIVYLTAYADKNTIERAKHTKPMGYIVKPFDEKDIFTTLEIALFNFASMRKPVIFDKNLINNQLHSPLTDKEFDIFKDIYEGKTNQQLADQHFISINTVKTHVKNLYDKLDVRSRTEAIVLLRSILKQG